LIVRVVGRKIDKKDTHACIMVEEEDFIIIQK
jgi:hypothetical protein